MLAPDHPFFTVAAFAWGALWGSFLNVVIYRLPVGESVVRPGSRCGACKTPIPWYSNIPILSWLVLRGRCGTCKAPFSIRYLLVEAATGALTAAAWVKVTAGLPAGEHPWFDLGLAWGGLFIFIASLVTIALIDLDTMRIPDALSLPPIVVGLLLGLAVPRITGVTLEDALLGTLIGGGTLWAITWGYFAITKREGMGLGDYRLMAMVGAFLGWRSLLFVLMASAVQGIIFALSVRAVGVPMPDHEGDASASSDSLRHFAIPFGPFIVLAALEWLVFERPLMQLLNTFIFHPGS